MLRTFRSNPTLSANQHGDYEEKVAQWFELFLDLLLVGACSSVAHYLEAHLTWYGFGIFLFITTQYTTGWLLYTNFVSRFNEPSLHHCVFLFILLCGFGGMVLGGVPNVAFTTGLLLVRVAVLAMYINIFYRLPVSRQQIWIDLTLLLASIAVLVVALNVGDPKPWYGALLIIEIPVRGIWMICRWFFPTRTHIYINIDHANERANNFVLVTLGEAVLAAIQNYNVSSNGHSEGDSDDHISARFYCCMLLSIFISFGIAMFYNTAQPPRQFHALRRSPTIAFLFYMVHFLLWPSIITLGVGTQLVKHAVINDLRLENHEVWILFGSLVSCMCWVIALRLLHYGGRQPAPWDHPKIRLLKYIWWAVMAVSPVHAVLDAVLLLHFSGHHTVDPIYALIAGCIAVISWIILETGIMALLIRLDGQFKLRPPEDAGESVNQENNEQPSTPKNTSYVALEYEGVV